MPRVRLPSAWASGDGKRGAGVGVVKYEAPGRSNFLVRVMSLCEKQKDLRTDDEFLFGLADLENRKHQNRDLIPRDKEPILSCFRNNVPYLFGMKFAKWTIS
jgi:hypothetical protein